jgi:hypothetical protein
MKLGQRILLCGALLIALTAAACARGGEFLAGALIPRQIAEVFERTALPLHILTLRSSNGAAQTLTTTAEHPVYALGHGWIAAGKLTAGMLLDDLGGRSTVTACRSETHRAGVKVYNLRVHESHTYFVREAGSQAEPVWVHNANGSYTNTHASGKTYSGKGDTTRAADSVAEKVDKYGDPLVKTETGLLPKTGAS